VTPPPEPDPRWQNFIGGLTERGQIRPMSFEVLEELAEDWAELVPAELAGTGTAALLDGILPANIAELGETGVELRNWLSHPATGAAFTIGMAGPMLENTHRIAVLVALAVDKEHPSEGSL
jgi:hypothetical protein